MNQFTSVSATAQTPKVLSDLDDEPMPAAIAGGKDQGGQVRVAGVRPENAESLISASNHEADLARFGPSGHRRPTKNHRQNKKSRLTHHLCSGISIFTWRLTGNIRAVSAQIKSLISNCTTTLPLFRLTLVPMRMKLSPSLGKHRRVSMVSRGL
jgi:hypothetical protein